MRKLLLLTDVLPCAEYSCGLFLRGLCRLLPKGSLTCYALTASTESACLDPELGHVPLATERGPSLPADSPHWLRPLRSLAYTCLEELPHLRSILPRVIEFGRDHQVQAVWCIVGGRTVTRLAVPVARALRAPLLTQVFDPPLHALQVNRVDRLTSRGVQWAFAQAIRASECCAAASWAMADCYRRSHGVESIAVVPSLDLAQALPPARQPSSPDQFVIALAGQIYAWDAWHALLNALETARWRILGKQVVLRLLGAHFDLPRATRFMRLEVLGYQTQVNTIALLSQADLLYCPYFFEAARQEDCRLCFPSKLTTYFAAGRPVLVHAPAHASPARFAEQTRSAWCCHSQEPARILDALEVGTDVALGYRLACNGRRALAEQLSLASLRRSFARFLGVNESVLASASWEGSNDHASDDPGRHRHAGPPSLAGVRGAL